MDIAGRESLTYTGPVLSTDRADAGAAKIERNLTRLFAQRDQLEFYIDFSDPAFAAGLGSIKDIIPANYGGYGTNPIKILSSGDFTVGTDGFAKSNGSLAYAAFKGVNTLAGVVVEFCPQPGQAGDGNVLPIAWGAMPLLAQGCMHALIGTDGVGFDVRNNGAGGVESTFYMDYAEPLIFDGSTIYQIAFLQDDNSIWVIGPNGEIGHCNDPRLRAAAGKVAFFESAVHANWVRRFYGFSRARTGRSPFAILASGAGNLVPPSGSGNGRTTIGSNYGRSQVSTFSGASDAAASLLKFGPEGSFSLRAKIRSAIAAGASTFLCSELLPDATYVIDYSGPSEFTISGISNANPAVITTSANHNFITGDRIYRKGLTGNFAAFNDDGYTGSNGPLITRLSATTFSVTGMNTTSTGAFSGPGTVGAFTSETITTSGTDLQGSGPGNLAISAISNANPAVLTAANHPFANGDIVVLSGLVGGFAAFNDVGVNVPNGRVVTKIDTNTFSLAGMNTTSSGAFPSPTTERVWQATPGRITAAGTIHNPNTGLNYYRIKLTGVFARPHRADMARNPVGIVNTTSLSAQALGLRDLFGTMGVAGLWQAQTFTGVTPGGDSYSARMNHPAGNLQRQFDALNNPSSFATTGLYCRGVARPDVSGTTPALATGATPAGVYILSPGAGATLAVTLTQLGVTDADLNARLWEGATIRFVNKSGNVLNTTWAATASGTVSNMPASLAAGAFVEVTFDQLNNNWVRTG